MMTMMGATIITILISSELEDMSVALEVVMAVSEEVVTIEIPVESVPVVAGMETIVVVETTVVVAVELIPVVEVEIVVEVAVENITAIKTCKTHVQCRFKWLCSYKLHAMHVHI